MDGSVKSILVVDDDTDLLFCYGIMLDNEGTEVITCDDVDEAQRIVRNQKIDLVILDYMMPKLRGDQLAKRIHAINDKIKIIFVSGYSEVVEAVKKLDIKVHGIFLKPVSPEVIEKIANSDIRLCRYPLRFPHAQGLHTSNIIARASR